MSLNCTKVFLEKVGSAFVAEASLGFGIKSCSENLRVGQLLGSSICSDRLQKKRSLLRFFIEHILFEASSSAMLQSVDVRRIAMRSKKPHSFLAKIEATTYLGESKLMPIQQFFAQQI